LYFYRQSPPPPQPEPAATARPEPEPSPQAPPSTPPAAAERPAPVKPSPSPPARKTTKPAPPPAATETAPAAATRATLTVESDVPGASVFVDRQFVGTAPVTLKDVAPGSKQINLVADGYEGISRTMDVSSGPQTVSMRFKEVRLDKRIAVTHKHGVGSCAGELVATVDGIQYVTSNAKDAAKVPLGALEQFEVNYLEKNLRIKQRGGRTWNFTNDAPNADALFVFHRDVEAARKKLAEGYAPVR
jgi:hypothetical protein